MSEKIQCIVVDDEPVARDIILSHLEKVQNIELIASCKNVVEALQVLNSKSVDLIFLDIHMPEISGLTLAKSVNNNTKIIFTTAYREYAVEGFDLQAVDYLLKPISFDRFLKAVQKYFNLHVSTKSNSQESTAAARDSIFVRSDRKMVKVRFEAIQYIESLSDYIKIYTEKEVIVTRETIKNIESKLPTKDFLRVHRSFIVSLKVIDSYTNEYVEVGNKAIPISRSYKETTLEKLQSK
jgi:DNA-binding LytR/AlgR family response regulator